MNTRHTKQLSLAMVLLLAGPQLARADDTLRPNTAIVSDTTCTMRPAGSRDTSAAARGRFPPDSVADAKCTHMKRHMHHGKMKAMMQNSDTSSTHQPMSPPKPTP